MSMKKDALGLDNPILSLCIPTNGAVNWVVPVLNSIFSQGCDDSLFEVIVTDNAKNSEMQKAVENFGCKNLRYYQSDAQGFYNIVDSFQCAKGIFCKLINHRAKMTDGSLNKLIGLIERHKEEQPVIYCTNGVLGNDKEELICKNLNELVWNLHYYCTWMAGIGIWRKDIPNLEGIVFNKMFPNTTILFEQRQCDSKYLLWNVPYFYQQDGKGKGCYNLFHTFAVVFPEMLNDLQIRKRITENTYSKVMNDLYGCLKDFYRSYVLLRSDSSFDITNIRQNMSIYYPWYKYYQMVWSCKKSFYVDSYRDWGHLMRLSIKRRLRSQKVT